MYADDAVLVVHLGAELQAMLDVVETVKVADEV